jgi:ferrous iron transport protein B
MSVDKADEVGIPISKVGVRRQARSSIAIIGNPNSGKSTLFNRLTGLRQTTGNYPGVTVEKHVGTIQLRDRALRLVDLPGIYCLGGYSADERIAVDMLLGRLDPADKPSGLLVVVDATHLYQGLYLLEQLLELQLPTVVALTMHDLATASGVTVDVDGLSKQLGGIPVVPVSSITGHGLSDLKEALAKIETVRVPEFPASWPELSRRAQALANETDGELLRIDVLQGLIHHGSAHDCDLERAFGEDRVHGIRRDLFGENPPQAEEARHRYAWVRSVLGETQHNAALMAQLGARLTGWVNRPWPATVLFFGVLVLVFQAVFSWATPLMDLIDGTAVSLGSWVNMRLGGTMLGSFLADGVIAGVGSVLVFLPQILILFAFIIVLEDTGYLARAAFLMDRVMRTVGLSGQSVIPMLSSFACAVPAIMATRVIPDRRDRFATILAAPFMTCSARLPIYALMIAAFVPSRSIGWFNLQGLVLFGLYLLGIFGGLVTAKLMKSSALKGPKPQFMLALPEFRRPNLQTVLIKLLARVRVFLKRAGTVIFAVAVLVWLLTYFPRLESAPGATTGGTESPMIQFADENALQAAQLSQSWLGRAGQVIEPVFRPLGWDWRVSAAVIAGFPAREVVVAVMGTIYAVGSEADEASLAQKLRSARWPDGGLIFTLPMVLGMLVFYAWCLQCAATVATIRRETNSWRWPIFAWVYMTGVAYLGAFLVYQIGSRLF